MRVFLCVESSKALEAILADISLNRVSRFMQSFFFVLWPSHTAISSHVLPFSHHIGSHIPNSGMLHACLFLQLPFASPGHGQQDLY